MKVCVRERLRLRPQLRCCCKVRPGPQSCRCTTLYIVRCTLYIVQLQDMLCSDTSLDTSLDTSPLKQRSCTTSLASAESRAEPYDTCILLLLIIINQGQSQAIHSPRNPTTMLLLNLLGFANPVTKSDFLAAAFP